MTRYEPAYEMPAATGQQRQQHPRSFDHFEVRPLSGALGAEVRGLDVRQIDDDAFEEVHGALLDHQVLTFPEQQLDPETQVEFARRFGALMPYKFAAPLPGHPYVTQIHSEPDDRFNFGGGWHSDSMNFERPPIITMLYCLRGPAVGGDTSFTNLYMAWDSLSDGLRRLLLEMRQITATSLSYGNSTAVGSDAFKQVTSTPTQMKPEEEDEEFEHPVARTHPETGRIALYVCSAYSARFAEMTRPESLPLLRHLWERAIQPEFTCRVPWRAGTLTLWDNRCCMHYAHNDYAGQVRTMHRVIVEGERPC